MKKEFAIAAIPSPTPMALSTKAWSTFDVEAALPTEAISFMKQCLLLAGV
jgi:hypothetical protein